MQTLFPGKVSAQPHVQVLVGLSATLRCNLVISGSEVLKQVRWVDGRNVTVLSYVSRHSVSAVEPERVTLTSATRDSSAITISMAGPRDEGCYTCIFDVYPTGPQEAQTCLVLTGKDHRFSRFRVNFSYKRVVESEIFWRLWLKSNLQAENILV